MRPTLLRAWLHSIVIASVTACSDLTSEATPEAQKTPMTDEISCTRADDASLYARLQAHGVDGITFFALEWGEGPDARPTKRQIGVTGTPCSTATNPTACAQAIQTATSDTGWFVALNDYPDYDTGDTRTGRSEPRIYGVVSAADTSYVVESVAALRPLVVPLETLDQAGAFARVANVPVVCGSANVRRVDAGYQFGHVERLCRGEVTETLRTLSVDGEVTSTSRELSPADAAALCAEP